MQIRKQNVQKKNKTRILVGAFFIAILLIVPVTRRPIRYIFVSISTPIVCVTHSVGNWFGSSFETLRFKSSLVAENTDLQSQIQNLNARYAGFDKLSRENKELKSSMNRAPESNFVLAVVLSKPPTSLYDTLLVDGGSSVGIQVGQTVYVNGTVPIGTVSEVFSKSAIVELYSSPSEKMDARLDPSHIDVTLFGHGGGDLLVSVPHDLSVSADSIVVSKEINPRVLGRLQKVISDPRDSSQTLIFSSPVNINEIEFVQIEQ